MEGTTFGSINEECVYSALTRLKLPFSYQYPLNGGRRVRGGQVIDFVVWIPPQPAALYVQGEYWHGGKREQEDMLKQADAQRAGFRVVELKEADTATPEQAQQTLMRELL